MYAIRIARPGLREASSVKSVVAIENVNAAIDQIAQTTLRKVAGQHTLDQPAADGKLTRGLAVNGSSAT
jgi:regulator of protease activity HflC (stomatin/prohibitin superfamily)